MRTEDTQRLTAIRDAIRALFAEGIGPFWLSRGVDRQHGGYLTCFDEHGRLDESDTDKYIVTQTRMIWGFSVYAQAFPGQPAYLDAARQGVDFFLRHFWDAQQGGWFWKVGRDGALIDAGKVMYGQGFAVYALAQYALSTGDARGLEYAGRTFDLLQRYCADTARGGYYENLERDWSLSAPGFAAGDRKSLDIHMHLLEAFTTLYEASRLEIHRCRLEEVIEVILRHMIDPAHGCGRNQFDLDFRPIPPIAIRRTWNAERQGQLDRNAVDTTSYGHNLELVWLLLHAADVMGQPRDNFRAVVDGLARHALRFGIDWHHGGVYRDGPHDAPASVRQKEWWQQCESLVGLLDAYRLLDEPRCLEAFYGVWDFAGRHFINRELGEWITLVDEDGAPLVRAIGNPWKAIYHSGRAMHETLKRLDALLEPQKNDQ